MARGRKSGIALLSIAGSDDVQCRGELDDEADEQEGQDTHGRRIRVVLAIEPIQRLRNGLPKCHASGARVSRVDGFGYAHRISPVLVLRAIDPRSTVKRVALKRRSALLKLLH
jgi:hypothetical protein